MPKLKIDSPHVYQRGGVSFPGVTSVLAGIESREWMNQVIASKGRREFDKICKDAAAMGTRIHSLADKLAYDRAYKCEEDLMPYSVALREFLDQNVDEVIATELSLTSEKERVGGTMDLVARMNDGQIAVIDWKSRKNNGVTDKDRMQTAAYALLLSEHGYDVKRRILTRLHTKPGWEGRYYWREFEDHWDDCRAFRAAVEIWHYRHRRQK